jgi:RNA polymerase sigma factor (sigma-70 family)
MTPDDMTLVREFAACHSEQAFAALVERYVNLVHSAALRQTGDPHLAEDITQAVFIILASKAAMLGQDTILPAWLYRTTRYTARNALTVQRRRVAREQEAYMRSTPQTDDTTHAWQQLVPLLDDAMDKLSARDRAAVVLRHFENRPWREVASLMHITEDAAQKRARRALEKLRAFFARRGVRLTAVLIAAAVSANSVQAAPEGMVRTISLAAVTKGASAAGSILVLVQGVLKIMAWSKIKTMLGIGTATVIAIGTGTAVLATWTKMAEIPKSVALALQAFNSTNASASDVDKANQRIEQVYADFFKAAPAGVFIQATQFEKVAFARRGENEIIGKTIPFAEMLARAFETNEVAFSTSRIVFKTEEPQGRYDYLVNVPVHGLEEFRNQIQKQFRLSDKMETCLTNALVLKVVGVAPSGATDLSRYDPQEYYFVAWNPTALANRLGELLHQPVIDTTQSKTVFTIALPRKSDDLTSLNKILHAQTGLELLPTNMPVEMLVVEKWK